MNPIRLAPLTQKASLMTRLLAIAVLATSSMAIMFYMDLPVAFAAGATTHGPYTTNFPLTENPISENGNWVNGGTTGLDWTNVQTTAGLAFGTMVGTDNPPKRYADSTAIVSGTWGPDQTAEATIFVANAPNSSSIFEEVELRLRTTITAHSITGYEINCSVSTNSSNNYLQIVRWNGSLASWTQLNGSSHHCVNGDVLKATVQGSTINVYLNGSLVESANDNTFSTGSPGIGFYLEGTTGGNSSYGFTKFTATDTSNSGSTQPPAPPTSLTAIVH